MFVCFSTEMPTLTLGEVGANTVTLSFNDSPPQLSGEPQRSITQYAVTFTPQDGSPSKTVFVPAEAGATVEVPGLEPETMYDITTRAVIETEGQGEGMYDLGAPLISVLTRKYRKVWKIGYIVVNITLAMPTLKKEHPRPNLSMFMCALPKLCKHLKGSQLGVFCP